MRRRTRKARIEECRFHTGEVEMNYAVGPEGGTPLVLIPGQTHSWESYERVLPSLAGEFTVYAVDVRGHGKSGRTPGAYSFESIGRDMNAFLGRVVRRPAVLTGNSSGGLIALWLAAYGTEPVLGVVLEDPPIFSAEWPRLRDDCYVYRVFERVLETVGSPEGGDLAAFFRDFELPVERGRGVMRSPGWIGRVLAGLVRARQFIRPGRPVDIPLLPFELRFFAKCLSVYDPDFTRAFLDGSACRGFDHADALQRVDCPMMLLHANWFRHPEFGLVGAMDDSDAERVRSLVPGCRYEKIKSGHVIHIAKPSLFIREVESLCAYLESDDQG